MKTTQSKQLRLAAAVMASVASASTASGDGLAIRAGKVITMNGGETVLNNAIVLVEDGVVKGLGGQGDTPIPESYRVIDASDKWVVPGLVDAHNHTAGSLADLNDMVYLTNPGLRTLETIVPDNDLIKQARAGGVTSVLLIPGSGTNISGFGTISKTAGRTVDEVVMRAPGSLKIAQAGNPEWYWYGVGRSYMNYNTRQTLEKALAYHERWVAFEDGTASEPPMYDPIFDDFRGLFQRKFPASVHTQIYQVVMTTVDMLAKKLKIRTIIDHGTFDGFKTTPVFKGSDVYTVNGPRQYWFDTSQRKMHGNCARWWQSGQTKLGCNTDAPVVPQAELSYQGAMACWYGWKPYEALKGVTRIPAEALMIDGEVGSIEVGKSADFGIWTGDPLDPRSSCEMTVVRGKVAYDANVKRRF